MEDVGTAARVAGMAHDGPPSERSSKCVDRLTPMPSATDPLPLPFQCDDAMPGSIPTRNGTPRLGRARCASAQPSPPDTSLPGHPKSAREPRTCSTRAYGKGGGRNPNMRGSEIATDDS